MDALPPVIEVAGLRNVGQGHTLALAVWATEPGSELEATLAGEPIPVRPIDGVWRILWGAPIKHEPGVLDLVISATDDAGNRRDRTVPIEVTETDFPSGGEIRLSTRQVVDRKNEAAKVEMRAQRDAVYVLNVPEQHWQGRMQLPIAGRWSSPFGKYRRYSDGRRSHHTGLDIARGRGRPAGASAAGVVAFAGWQHIFGNVVMLHHGHGVVTSYNHLDSIDVSEGDRVEPGQVVGRIGSTGQSTGPHLHWVVVVDGEAVEPVQWLNEDFDVEALQSQGWD